MDISYTGIMLIAAGVCGIATLILYHAKRLHMYREAGKFAGPPVLPVIGNALHFAGDTADFLNKIMGQMKLYASPFRMWLGQNVYIVIYNHDDMQTILNSPNALEKDFTYKYVRAWVGTGLVNAPVAKWRTHRKLIQMTFNQRILDTYVEIFARHAKILASKMSKEVNKGEFDIMSYMELCAFDIMCETTMGINTGTQTGNGTGYFEAARGQIQIAIIRSFKVWLRSDFIFQLTKYGRDQRKYVKYLHSISNDIIDKKMNAYKNSSSAMNEKTEIAKSKKPTAGKIFLDSLMELSNEGSKLTRQELREEVDTMLMAGTDTNATTDCLILMMFANHPDIQKKAYQELCEIYGDEISSDTPVSKEDLRRMVYLERVIKETLRLFPAAPLVARSVTGDIKLGDRTVPKGSSVLLGIFKIHRSEKYWPDPLKFDPDRFLPDEVAKRHPYCYLPFSGGPRGCVGTMYAMMTMKATIATLLRRYIFKKDKFFNVEDIKVRTDFVLKPVETLTLKIVERTANRNVNCI